MEKMNIYQKINAIQKKVTSVTKDAEISVGKDTYEVVTHDAVTSLLHEHFAGIGLVAIPNMENSLIKEHEIEKEWNGKITKSRIYRTEMRVSVTFVNTDDPTDNFKVYYDSYAFDSSDKAPGKAFSMAIKNIYLKVFMLESKDNEEARVVESETKYAQKPTNYAPNTNGVSEAQLKRLFALTKQSGWSDNEVKTFMKDKLGVLQSKDLNREQYDTICNFLSNKTSYHIAINS